MLGLRFSSVRRVFRQGDRDVAALEGIDLEIAPGEFVAVTGPSGSGKSTLLHLAGALDLPTSGEVVVNGRATAQMTEEERTRLRRETIGFLFQFFHLLPSLTVEENVALPLLLSGERRRRVAPRVALLLERMGVTERRGHVPQELSGGELQRVALARALVIRPSLILADEPTGNLDSESGADVLALLRSAADDDGCTVLMVTHDERAAARADGEIRLRDGRVAAPALIDPPVL